MRRFSIPAFRPRWPSLQVEVTTRCGARCTYCPHTLCADAWQSAAMPMELYERLVPSFSRVRHIHLQGWGEPTRHPHFITMVAHAAAHGCTVSTTTCGTGLNDTLLSRLTDAGLHTIAVTFAGSAPTHDALRPGAPHAAAIDLLSRIQAFKHRTGSPLPHVHLAWLTTVTAVEDVKHIPALMQTYDVREATISGISLVLRQELERECFATLTPEAFTRAVRPVVRVLDAAFDTGLRITARVPVPPAMINGDPVLCPEPVTTAPVLTVDGTVTPCINGYLPAPDARHWFHGRSCILPRMKLGSLRKNNLETIWSQPDTKRFRKQAAKGTLPAPCVHCYARYIRPIRPSIPPPGNSMMERLEFLRACGSGPT